MKVGTLLKDKWRDDNLYVVVGEEANYKESPFPLVKMVKMFCLKRSIYTYRVLIMCQNDFEILSP